MLLKTRTRSSVHDGGAERNGKILLVVDAAWCYIHWVVFIGVLVAIMAKMLLIIAVRW
jgi:hypothetical protein